jgi:hypothetical protein
VFKKSVTTNPEGLPHNFGKLKSDPALTHSRYNEEALKAVEGEIAKIKKAGNLKGGKLSGAQATDIVKRIKKDGLGNSYVLKFNRAVLESLRLAALGGIAMRGLEEVAKAQHLADRVAKNGHYKKALAALQSGDWHKADNEIRGGHLSEDNLLWDLRIAGYVREAGILQDRWMKRVEEFRRVERGQRVAGVPDDF